MAFQVVEAAETDPVWELVSDPPGVVDLGGRDFIMEPDGADQRAYVNGLPVILMQPIEQDDLLLITGPSDRQLSYRHVGRRSAHVEDGRGRPCAFTGMPIQGPAVRCAACGRVIAREVVEEDPECICGLDLGGHGEIEPPGKELL